MHRIWMKNISIKDSGIALLHIQTYIKVGSRMKKKTNARFRGYNKDFWMTEDCVCVRTTRKGETASDRNCDKNEMEM